MAQESRNVAGGNPPVAPPVVAKSAPRRSTPTQPSVLVDAKLNLAGEDRRRLIAEAAYFRAERRGFQAGRELEDWLAAEIEVDALLGEDDGTA